MIRKSFKCFLGTIKLPEAVSEERVQELLPLLRTGDKLAFAELARGYIRLALSIVAEYRFEKQEANDLTGQALMGLVEGLKRVSDGALKEGTHLTNFVCNRIRYRLQDFFEEKEETSKRKSLETIESILKMGINDIQKITNEKYFLQKFVPIYRNNFKILEINEILKKIVKNDLERTIITLRSEGYYDVEIAEKVGCSSEYIRQVGKVLQKRFSDLYD